MKNGESYQNQQKNTSETSSKQHHPQQKQWCRDVTTAAFFFSRNMVEVKVAVLLLMWSLFFLQDGKTKPRNQIHMCWVRCVIKIYQPQFCTLQADDFLVKRNIHQISNTKHLTSLMFVELSYPFQKKNASHPGVFFQKSLTFIGFFVGTDLILKLSFNFPHEKKTTWNHHFTVR